MATKRQCELCAEDMEDAPAIHDPAKCQETELLKGRQEIKKLKESVKFWKDAWYEGRDIIGDLWWHHPAIDNDDERAYYQQNLRNIERVNDRIAKGLCTNLACTDCAAKENCETVFYSGFVGTTEDWHYQAWMKSNQ